MDNIEQLKQNNEKLNARLAKAVEVFKEQKANIEKLALEAEELEKTIESKDKAYQTLQDTYNEVFAENVKLKNDIAENSSNRAESESIAIESKEKINKLENEIIELKKINDKNLEDAKLDYDKLQKEHNSLMDTYNKLNNEYSDVYKKYNDLQEQQIKYNDQINSYKEKEEKQNEYINGLTKEIKEKKDIIDKCDEEINLLDKDNNKLKEELEKTKKICDDFENEKLSWEADYQAELNAYKELQDAYERLRNERDIYSKSDDVLAEIIKVLIDNGLTGKTEITPNTPIKEDGKMHRMGSNLEGGKNIGV